MIPADVRAAVYRRLHWLWPLLARPGVRRGLRGLAWGAFALWLGFVALALTLRFAVIPGVGAYRGQIEEAASRAIGQTVRIGELEGRWKGLNPELVLSDVHLLDRQGAEVFSLARVEGVLSWQSILRLQPILGLLTLDRPVLGIRRETDGRITIAGVDTEGESDPALARWVLDQPHIRIRNATIRWDDRQRGAPPLMLRDVQFGLDNRGSRHRFGLSAMPPAELAARIDLRGELRGDIGEALTTLSGKLFLELEYADLAGWAAWVDYPVQLPRGHGAVRLWGDLKDGAGELTADVALEDVRLRMGKELNELDLAEMRGRLVGNYAPDRWSVAGRKLELRTADGVRVAPTNFDLTWRTQAATGAVDGDARVSTLDFAALGKLAALMPLDPRSRELLTSHQPQGVATDVRASWSLAGDELKRYAFKGNFAGLGILAGGYFPGATGVTGSVDLNEKGGTLSIDSAASSLSLPAVFPEPDIALDKLNARASWVNKDGATDLKLERLEFSGPDASGSAKGSYRYAGDGPGVIDLQAAIDRADGSAVWRYMPHAVNADARQWLRRGIVSGQASKGKLVLKGDLKDFPFRDPATGTFVVTAHAANTRIDYADGWPAIDGVEGDMSFGVGMKVLATRGRILGTTLSDVRVEIPDFESHEELLKVNGGVQGPTAEFLRFIDLSPVAEKIDRFTEGMKATGDGHLNLGLEIPLRRVERTRVRGDFRFLNNQVALVPALPPLTRVNGRLGFTENDLNANDINGQVFGGPVKVQARSTGGKVAVQASGMATMTEVSRHFGWPLINQLAGKAGWKADVTIKKRNADVVVTSDLIGVTSPLPDPLNKTAAAALPLRIERTPLDAQRDQFRISLGKVMQGLLVQRGEQMEKGVLALGGADLRLPENGLAIRLAMPRVDADAWRAYLGGAEPGEGGGAAEGGQSPVALLSIRTPQLRLMGRDFSQVDAILRPRGGSWLIALNTREAQGDLVWKSAGEGWIEGNFRKLIVRPPAESDEVASAQNAALNSLPGMSLSVDELWVGDKSLGRLDLKARNEKGAWRLDTLKLSNPDGSLSGQGIWNNTGRQQTRLDFELAANDIGRLLDRLGYVDAVKRGSARLTGALQWNGPLVALDYPSLSGRMSVHAEKGQFHKLEPGVGKLLGLISLQSLPRRLTLDFRDIFSDGLAFDSIDGNLAVHNGRMRTSEPLRINGPAAQVEIDGSTDLQKETQDLRVLVRPEIGGLAAVGTAALLNPAVGAAALVANTVLQRPLNRLFSYRYHVTGTWSDPKIDKAGESVAETPSSEEAK